jgi:hypothetical protein
MIGRTPPTSVFFPQKEYWDSGPIWILGTCRSCFMMFLKVSADLVRSHFVCQAPQLNLTNIPLLLPLFSESIALHVCLHSKAPAQCYLLQAMWQTRTHALSQKRVFNRSRRLFPRRRRRNETHQALASQTTRKNWSTAESQRLAFPHHCQRTAQRQSTIRWKGKCTCCL